MGFGPRENPASGSVGFIFVCNSIDWSEWEKGSPDGTTMGIIFFPLDTPPQNLFYYYSPNLCPEPPTNQELIINDIYAIKVNTDCNYGLTDQISEYYIFQTQNNLVIISYQAQSQFEYDRHYEEFLRSINTLQIQS